MVGSTILVIGASGQLARALARLRSPDEYPVVCRGRPEADVADPLALQRLFEELSPAAVVNTAAYTAVDKAEAEPDLAFAINAAGPERLAAMCRDRCIPLIHVSTDYVFDGIARTPYEETHPIAPLGSYGASKAAGETAVRRSCPQHVILRGGWLYSMDGHCFLNTILRLGAQREELCIVDDQHGAPTWTHDLAAAIAAIVRRLLATQDHDLWGTYHLTAAGETTWFGFAEEIFRLRAVAGHSVPRLKSITTAEYPTPARRPAYSVLDNGKIGAAFGIRLPHWRDGLARCLARARATGATAAEDKVA